MSDNTTVPNSDPNTNSGTTPDGNGRHRCGPRGRRRGIFVAGAALLIGLAGFGVGRATSHPRHGFGLGIQRAFDADTAGQRAEKGINFILDKVDATVEQKSKIDEIAKSAIKDLAPLQQAHIAARDKFIAALKADKVDRAAIEQARTEQLALGETLSKRAAQAIADAADVLTPAQRAKLIDRWQTPGPRGWFGRG
jgi:periplasmic protein CpxP/Spy